MRTPTSRAALFLALSCLATPLAGQESAAPTRAELDAALGSRRTSAQAERDLLSRVLARPEVESAAEGAGLTSELDRVREAVPLLSGERLSQAAEQGRALEEQLAGGGSMVISTTTIIIVLLLIVIIILIAD